MRSVISGKSKVEQGFRIIYSNIGFNQQDVPIGIGELIIRYDRDIINAGLGTPNIRICYSNNNVFDNALYSVMVINGDKTVSQLAENLPYNSRMYVSVNNSVVRDASGINEIFGGYIWNFSTEVGLPRLATNLLQGTRTMTTFPLSWQLSQQQTYEICSSKALVIAKMADSESATIPTTDFSLPVFDTVFPSTGLSSIPSTNYGSAANFGDTGYKLIYFGDSLNALTITGLLKNSYVRIYVMSVFVNKGKYLYNRTSGATSVLYAKTTRS